MRTRSSTRFLWQAIAAIALLFLTPGLPAAAGSGASIGGPNVGPVAGPIEVFTEAEALSTPLGSILETTILVENHGRDPAKVLLRGLITWPDGSTQHLRYGPPVTIGRASCRERV